MNNQLLKKIKNKENFSLPKINDDIHDTFKVASEEFIKNNLNEIFPISEKKGIVICGGGKYLTSLYVSIKGIRHFKCNLPISIFHYGDKEISFLQKKYFKDLNVNFFDVIEMKKKYPFRRLISYSIKIFALCYCEYEDVLLLDADNCVLDNPDFIFDSSEYKKHNCVFFKDAFHLDNEIKYYLNEDVCNNFNLKFEKQESIDSGQIYINKINKSKELQLVKWWNEFNDYSYEILWGDKDLYLLSFKQLNSNYFVNKYEPIRKNGLLQFDLNGNALFSHRCGETAKFNDKKNIFLDKPCEDLYHNFAKDFFSKTNIKFL